MALHFGMSCKQRSEFGSCDAVELSMGDPTAITATPAAGGRLKREEASSVKHDSTFSQWKILLGASDWKDHSLGKEGAERYRIHNLPNCTSCPGVYELGVGISRPRLGRDERKLDSSAVVPVYLGQADNVRNRLQQYGREGAHLGNRRSNGEAVGIYKGICSDRGPGLFNEIFSKGFQIVYRWAPMKNKKDAEITEALLLERFDYAWNKGSNGARRTDDILKKLNLCTRESLFSLLSKKLRLFNRKRVGIEIKTEPLILENRDDLCTDMHNNRRFSKNFKIRRSQPILVSSPYSSSNVCGVAIGNGSVCTEPTVEGRKRCPEHKGMKVNGFTSKLDIGRKDSSDGYQNHGLTHRVIDQPYSFELHINHNNHLAPTCGVILDDGSPCKRPPTHRNKRCMVHKGRRVSRSTPKFVGEEVEQNSLYSGRDVCGVKIEDGKICMRQPVSGRKRCNLHKGMKCL